MQAWKVKPGSEANAKHAMVLPSICEGTKSLLQVSKHLCSLLVGRATPFSSTGTYALLAEGRPLPSPTPQRSPGWVPWRRGLHCTHWQTSCRPGCSAEASRSRAPPCTHVSHFDNALGMIYLIIITIITVIISTTVIITITSEIVIVGRYHASQ